MEFSPATLHPPVLSTAAHHAAAREGFTKYTPNTGILPLREALVDKLARTNGIMTTPDKIVVTPGAVAALACAFIATAGSSQRPKRGAGGTPLRRV